MHHKGAIGDKTAPFEASYVSDIEIRSHSLGNTLQLKRQGLATAAAQVFTTSVISFDKHSPDLKTELPGAVNATILQSNVKLKNLANSINQAASFERPGDQVWVRLPDYLFINQKKQIGDFTIFFRIQPYKLNHRMEIFRKIGLFEGDRFGIQCLWQDGHLIFEFLNLFHGDNGTEKKIVISSRDPLKINVFQNVRLQYNESSGAMTLTIDDMEQQKKFISIHRGANDTLLNGFFHKWDKSPLIIGSSFSGALDEMLLSNSLTDLDKNVGNFHRTEKSFAGYQQKSGIFLSKRYQLGSSASQFERISLTTWEPNSAKVKLFFRSSDAPFAENSPENLLPFKELKSQRRQQGEDFYYEIKNFATGRYFQYMLQLFPSYDGSETPQIKNLRISAQENLPPRPPQGLTVSSNQRSGITLTFLRNVEMDVIKGGRYHIYYGIAPYKPLGVIRFKDIQFQNQEFSTQAITDKDVFRSTDLQKQNRLQIHITNDLIAKHIHWASKDPQRQFEYPMLEADVAYFFWVTACDNQWREAPEYADHESKPSNYVSVRPE